MLLTHSSKYSSPNTRMRVYTRHRHDLSKPPPLSPPLSPLSLRPASHVTLAHIDSSMCAFWSSERMLHCAQFLPPRPPTSTAVLLLPSPTARASFPSPDPRNSHAARHATPQEATLIISIFPIRCWGAGSERATHSPTPFYFLAAFSPTPSENRLHHPLTCTPYLRWPAEGKISIFICFFAGYVSPSPPLVPSPLVCSLLSAIPSSASTFEILSVWRTFFFFLVPSFFFLLPSTTSYCGAAPRVRETNEERDRRQG